MLDAEQPCGRERRQRVLEIEAPAELQVDAVERSRAELGIVGEPEGERVGQLGGEAPAVLVADVHCRGWAALHKEPALRLEVVLHVRVEVEMLVAQVGEHERSEAHTVEAVQCRRVGRRLHRHRPVARVEHLPEEPLEVDRLRRRSLDAATLAADAGLDRPDQAGPSTGGGEDRIEQKRRRRLSVRAGDPGHPQLRRRPLEELVGDLRHRDAR